MSRADNATLRKKCAQQVQDLAEFGRDINLRVGRIDELEKERDGLVDTIHRHMEEKRSLATRLNACADKEMKQQNRYEKLIKDHGSISRCNQRMDDENGVLENTIAELRELTDNYEDRNVRLEIEIANLRGVPPPTQVAGG
jgi:chromosome segregation ATPase